MKTKILIIAILLIFNSCKAYREKYYYKLTDGKWITKKELRRSMDEYLNQSFDKVPQEDLNLLFEVPIEVEVIHEQDCPSDSLYPADTTNHK
jgi:hypothetical protein